MASDKRSVKDVESDVKKEIDKPKGKSIVLPTTQPEETSSDVDIPELAAMPDWKAPGHDDSLLRAHYLNLKAAQAETWNKLPKSQQDAIQDFTGNKYVVINAYMRGTLKETHEYILASTAQRKELEKYCSKTSKNLEKALAKFSIPYHLTVERKAGLEELSSMGLDKLSTFDNDEIEKINSRLRSGEKIVYKKPNATSTSVNKNNPWYGEIVIRTVVPEGTKAFYAEPVSKNGAVYESSGYSGKLSKKKLNHIRPSGENEILFPSSTKYQILNLKKVDNKLYVYTIAS